MKPHHPSFAAIGIAVVAGVAVLGCAPTDLRGQPVTAPAAARPASVKSQMRVDMADCTPTGSRGTVTNGSAITVDIVLSAQVLDSGGVLVGDDLYSIMGLRAGETARWEAPFYGDGSEVRCRIEVYSAGQH